MWVRGEGARIEVTPSGEALEVERVRHARCRRAWR